MSDVKSNLRKTNHLKSLWKLQTTLRSSLNLPTLRSLQNLPTTLQSLWDSQTTFIKFVEAASNFSKFVGLTNNFWKVCKIHKYFMKFVDWKVGFKCLKVFLFKFYLCKYFNW